MAESTKSGRQRYDWSVVEAHPASDVQPMSVELLTKVEVSDYPVELIERVLAARCDRRMIAAWIDDGFPTPAMVEVWIAQVEVSLGETLICRTATWQDYDMLIELCAHSPETVGEWTVTVERAPNPYAAYRLQEHANVNVLEDRRFGLGMTAASGRNTYIDGQRTSVNCMSGWRIRDGFRGMGLSNALRQAAGPGTSFFGLVTYYYVRQQNSSAAWIDYIEADMNDRPQGYQAETENLTASLSVFPTGETIAAVLPAGSSLRPAVADDLPRCIELINRTHAGLDLFRPYTREYIETRLDDPHWGPKPSFNPEVYGWADYRVLERDGEIVACGGLWDRGRDIREVWTKGSDSTVFDPTALMDFGFADSEESTMATLIEGFVHESELRGRSGLMAALEFLPELQAATDHLRPRLDTRELHVMPFSMPGLELDLTVRRPYTDIAYW